MATFVRWYEEPLLQSRYGEEYDALSAWGASLGAPATSLAGYIDQIPAPCLSSSHSLASWRGHLRRSASRGSRLTRCRRPRSETEERVSSSSSAQGARSVQIVDGNRWNPIRWFEAENPAEEVDLRFSCRLDRLRLTKP